MSDADIIARLKLNGTQFSSELKNALGDAERKFGNTGSVIGRNISEGIGGGLQDAASRVPVLGGAISGLSGPALLAAGSIGAITAVLAKGVSEAEGFQESVRGLNALLKANGNATGYSSEQLIAFAEELEGQFAIAAEEIINAEKVLSSFDGVAGSTFQRAIKDAADLAAVYGGDITSNAEKLGTALQNLAVGDVTGLSKAFKFLGVDTLGAIEELAKAGKTAEAQTALLDALEKQVGGASEAKASGLSGAFFRLGDAIGDATREIAIQSGLYDGLVSGIDDTADAIGRLTARLGELNGFKLSTSVAAVLASGGNPTVLVQNLQAMGLDKSKRPDFSGAGGAMQLWEQVSGEVAARQAAERAYENRRIEPRKPKKAGGKSDAEKAADEAERQRKALADTTRELSDQVEIEKLRAEGLTFAADMESRLLSLRKQFPKATREELDEAEKLTIELLKQKQATEDRAHILGLGGGMAAEARKGVENEVEQAERAEKEAQERLAAQQKEDVRELAYFFEDIMTGGADAFWDNFEQAGRRAIAKIAAEQAIKLLGGSDSDISVLLKQLGQGAAIGTAAGSIGTSVLGIRGSRTGGAIGGALGSATGIPGMDIVGGMIGSAIGGALKKTKKGSATIGFEGGQLGVTSLTGNSAKFKKAAGGAGDSVVAGLQSIAEALGGTLGGTPTVSIGVRHGDYRVDTTGRGITKKKKGAIDFDDDAEGAIRYAIADALKDGVIQGISDAAKRILQSGQDLDKAIEKATAIEEIPKRLQARLDPVGFAIDELNRKWASTVATLKEGGATAAQMADAQKLYNLELADTVEQAGSATASLKDFLDSLKVGSNSPFSLRDQEAAAMAALDPYLSKIDAGQSIDQENYLKAAQDYLDVQRQLNGSGEAYFEALAKIQAATNKAISSVEAATPIRNPAADPFAEKTATATQATAEIAAQQTQVLVDVRTLLQRIAAGGGVGATFIGAGRNFV